MSREAMKMALEALVFAQYEDRDYDDVCDQKVRAARNALSQALAQPEQEPVAWLSEGGDVSRSKRYMDEMGFKCNPLYTAPPKQWVGLTDEECIKSLPVMPYEYEFNVQALLEYTKIVEAKLKEKNT